MSDETKIAYEKVDKCKKLMGQIDEVLSGMTVKELIFYITLVEEPHTRTLIKCKKIMERKKQEHEKN